MSKFVIKIQVPKTLLVTIEAEDDDDAYEKALSMYTFDDYTDSLSIECIPPNEDIDIEVLENE